MVDRKRLKNPNGLILGTPGSGKSFSAKREILNVFLITNDDIIVCDPEGEYSFDPTWHTIKDDMDNIDRNTLKAVGQTVMGVIYNEK